MLLQTDVEEGVGIRRNKGWRVSCETDRRCPGVQPLERQEALMATPNRPIYFSGHFP